MLTRLSCFIWRRNDGYGEMAPQASIVPCAARVARVAEVKPQRGQLTSPRPGGGGLAPPSGTYCQPRIISADLRPDDHTRPGRPTDIPKPARRSAQLFTVVLHAVLGAAVLRQAIRRIFRGGGGRRRPQNWSRLDRWQADLRMRLLSRQLHPGLPDAQSLYHSLSNSAMKPAGTLTAPLPAPDPAGARLNRLQKPETAGRPLAMAEPPASVRVLRRSRA